MDPLSSELLSEIVSRDAQGILVVDASGPAITIVFANPAYAAMSGYSEAVLDGADWLAQAAVDDDSPELLQLRQALGGDDPVDQSVPFSRPDGEIWLARMRLSRLAQGGGERRLWLVQHSADSSSQGASAELLKRALGVAKRKLASLDRIDQVTGLLSRGHFEMLLRNELAVARREARPLCLLLFEVPELDIYRRTFGDNAADSCLRMIGAQITGTFRRASDLCARVDETVLAVAALGQGEEEADQLVALVEKKARNLGLHNPRARLARHVLVRGAWSMARAAGDEPDCLLTRARAVLNARSNSDASVVEPA